MDDERLPIAISISLDNAKPRRAAILTPRRILAA